MFLLLYPLLTNTIGSAGSISFLPLFIQRGLVAEGFYYQLLLMSTCHDGWSQFDVNAG
jgi:hypothetical protein